MQQITSPKTSRDWVLLPNQRMLALYFARHLIAEPGRDVRVAPPAQVFSVWVQRTATQIDLLDGHPLPASAGAMQVQLAWQQAVLDSDPSAHLSLVRNLARQARAADRLIRQWYAGTPQPWLDARFLDWRRRAGLALAGAGSLCAEDWMEHLCTRLERAEAPHRVLPERIDLRGFVELTRLEQRLLDALRLRGVGITHDAHKNVDSAAGAAEPEVRTYAKPDQELRAAASWALEQVRLGRSRVAVIVADPDTVRTELQPVFDRVLHPHDWPRCASDGESLYHLPGGTPLAAHGMIADALMLLRLSLEGGAHAQAFPMLSRLILSVHVAGADSERMARAQFELRLRTAIRHRCTPRDLARLIRHWNLQAALPELLRLLGRLPRMPRSDDPAAAFSALLVAWGWPGPAAQGRLAQRRLDRFAVLLEELRSTGAAPGPAALDALAQACRDTLVTERGGPLSPVQVLAPEDAVGSLFDAIWVLRADGDTWPGRPFLNPLLPPGAGERIPRTTAAGMLEYTRRLHAELLRAAPSVVFSWSRQSADALRLPSPLLTRSLSAVPDVPAAPAPSASPWATLLAAERPTTGYVGHAFLQAFDDVHGLPVPRGESLPGGASLFEAQAGCPLDAYLRYRLRARFEPMPGPFADPAYRGNLLHAALQQLYAAHCGKPGSPPADAIEAAIEAGLDAKRARQRLDAVSLAAERARLRRALREWLDLERERRGFIVDALEREAELDYGGVRIGTRIDRIDRLGDGRLLLLDYKSSGGSVTEWSWERLGLPQLPLYAVLLTECEGLAVAGAAIAVVRSGATALAGIVDDPQAACEGLPGTGSGIGFARKFADWEALYRHWKSGIDALLAEILAGEAPNRVWDRTALDYSEAVLVLRRSEGEAWLAAHGSVLAGDDDA